MLTIFGVIAVSIMAAAYWLENRSPGYTLLFAAASLATAIYSGLSEVYPIMVIEGIWSLMALLRFRTRLRDSRPRGQGASSLGAPALTEPGLEVAGFEVAGPPDQPVG